MATITPMTVQMVWVFVQPDSFCSSGTAEPVKLFETSGDLNYLCGLLGLDGRAGLVDPYFAGQGRG